MEFNNSWKTFCYANSIDWPFKELTPGLVCFSLIIGLLACGFSGIILILFCQFLRWRRMYFRNQDLLRKANKTNELLISELNHRVKNNLQIAISLLKGQAAFAGQPDVADAIQNGCNRLYVMSLAFHTVYDGELISVIDLKEYIDKLILYLKDEFQEMDGIVLQSEIDPCLMNIAQAVPLGLIISEAVSNAYKFAFSGKQDGLISVLLKNKNSVISLSVCDNGIGLPEPFETLPAQAFGLSLIEGLGRQLSAIVNIKNSKGVTVSLEIAQPGQTLSKNYMRTKPE